MANRPNVIIILSDDQGYGDFSCHGNPVVRTPNFDRLYGESIRFEDFHVTPMCTPTRGQIMSGLDSLRNGATSVCGGRSFLRRGIPTMADIFLANGYRTGLFGKWHLGESYPFRPEYRGFEETLYFPSATITCAPDHWNNDYFDDTYRHNGIPQAYTGYCTDVFFAEAMQWMQHCQAEGQPFFTYLATGADHMPYYVPDHYRDPYRHLDLDLASFFGMVANYDENMGKLEDFLEQRGLRENTLVIFMTDNGAVVSADLYNAGMRGGKCSLYHGGHRVPCFVRWPAGQLRAPGAIEQPAQCQDLLPTLIDLCALEGGGKYDGVSLAGVLRDEQALLADRMLVVQYGEPSAWQSTVIWGSWQLLWGVELYNLADDPGQQRNIAEQHPDIVQQMRRHYEQWWEGLGENVSAWEGISVGNDAENPVRLSSIDWRGPIFWYQTQIRGLKDANGEPSCINGPWNLQVERDGDYEIALRRWPTEADAPITGSLPTFIPTDTAFMNTPMPPAENPQRCWIWTSATPEYGKALPINSARCRIGEFDQSIPVAAADKAALFHMPLQAGTTTLQTWFYDKDGKEISGAFYVDVRRMG